MYLHRYEHGIARMAKVLEVSESGYYKWMKKLNGPLTEKEMEDLELTREIYDIFKKYHGIFGARKITVLLNKGRKESVNHKRVERIMSENMLYAKTSKRYVKTTDSDHDEPIADNLVARDFLANAPDQKFLSDTTVVATDKGYLYVAVILDLYGRIPVGLAMSTRNDKHLVMDALEDMLIRGRGGKDAWIHSDRGSTYCSEAYRNMLIANGLICSMSRKGDCWDNAPMESFWGKMKTEWMQKKYATIEAAKRDIYEYVWSFYPKQRPHASLGYLTPVEYCNQAINY